MALRYYFAHDGVDHGPYSAEQMRALAARGGLRPTDPVWQEGTPHRFPASRIGNLFEDTPDGVEPDAPETLVAADAVAEPTAAELTPEPAFAPPEEKKTKPRVEEKDRLKRVVSIKGGILCGQDGRQVQFRKKCLVCQTEEQNRTTATIRAGSMKIPFFCRKCRKGRTVEMMGSS